MQNNVFMYYGLSNFYQNHRRYVKSRDDSQLNGDLSALKVCSWNFCSSWDCVRLPMIVFHFYRTQVKNVTRTALVRDSPLLHVVP